MAILWSRADGYVLTERAENFATPEPWVDPWKTKTRLSLPAGEGRVAVRNCIGQPVALPVAAGSVTLTLDGAPSIVTGLDRGRMGKRIYGNSVPGVRP